MNKDELRIKMKSMRRALTSEQIDDKSKSIIDRFTSLDAYKHADCVAVYLSAFKEPDTAPLIKTCLKSGKRAAAPITHTDTRTLTLSYIQDCAHLKKGAYGISEPPQTAPADKDDIDVIAVPALAFDISGNRLGFGMGYYDGLLADIRALKVGFCYDFQLVNTIPAQKHDIPMDIIITETRILNINGGSNAV